jgi:hypothetical protein
MRRAYTAYIHNELLDTLGYRIPRMKKSGCDGEDDNLIPSDGDGDGRVHALASLQLVIEGNYHRKTYLRL